MDGISKHHAFCWIQFQDKAAMNQWVISNKEVPEPTIIIAELDWDNCKVYFINSIGI